MADALGSITNSLEMIVATVTTEITDLLVAGSEGGRESLRCRVLAQSCVQDEAESVVLSPHCAGTSAYRLAVRPMDKGSDRASYSMQDGGPRELSKAILFRPCSRRRVGPHRQI